MSDKTPIVIDVTLCLTLALFGVTSLLPVKSLWCCNHLSFLGSPAAYIYWVIVALALFIAVVRLPCDSIDKAGDIVAHSLCGPRPWLRLGLAVFAVLLFYFCRAETHLIGDGYAWLVNLGRGHSYIHKWTEPGSTYLVRWLQALQGEYTRESARTAFQILSILSGAVFVYNAVAVVGQLCLDKRVRLVALATLLFSGTLLLFFGSVEFYSMSWAATMLLINVSLRYIRDLRWPWLVIVVFVIAVMLHVQALYFLPGLVLMYLRKVKRPVYKKVGYGLVGLGVMASVILLVWLYHNRVDIEVLFLPLLQGRPVAPDYTVLSLAHLYDLIKIALLVFPGCFAILVMWFFSDEKNWRDPVPSFLAFLSVGSLTFLLLFGAATTMGRDWDIMSLSLLAPVLLVLYHIDRGNLRLPARTLILYIVLISFMTVSYISVSVQVVPSEKRAYSLLNNYNRNAWLNYGSYFSDRGDSERFKQILDETVERFPHLALLWDIGECLTQGDSVLALKLARDAVNCDPYEPDYLQVLAMLCAKAGLNSEAKQYYQKALLLRPYNAELLLEVARFCIVVGQTEEAELLLAKAGKLNPGDESILLTLALAYHSKKRYADALAIADSLFVADRHSPSGHFIKMIVAISMSNREEARNNYLEYIKHAPQGPDYETIKKVYEFVLD